MKPGFSNRLAESMPVQTSIQTNDHGFSQI
jgi:hypothetical protein